MKRLYILLFSVLIFQNAAFAGYTGDTESLIGNDVNIFIKTKTIGTLLKNLSYALDNIFDVSAKKEIMAKRNVFKSKTGIDYLDESSLKDAGVDTDREISFVNTGRDKGDRMMFFIPVLNEKEFPLKFVQIVKKMKSGKNDADIYPVMTLYKGSAVYQIGKDIFATAFNGYFVVASRGGMIKEVINRRDSHKGTLIRSQEYSRYLSRGRRNFDVNFYIPGDFIRRMSSPGGSMKSGKGGSGVKRNTSRGSSSADSDIQDFLASIDYTSGGVGLLENRLRINGSVSLTSGNPMIEYLMGILKTGEGGHSLDAEGTDASMFLSIDYDHLNKSCKKDMPGCVEFKKFKNEFKKNTGLNFEKDIIPYSRGVMNVITQDSGAAGGMGDYAVFFPFNNQVQVAKIWSKMRNVSKKKYGSSKKFGKLKIDGHRGYWFIDENKIRNFVSYDKRGIFAGNSRNVIAKGLKSKVVNEGSDNKIRAEKTFLMINIKKNAFVKSMLMMRTGGNAEVAKAMEKIGEIFIYCDKNLGVLSADIDIKFVKVK